MAAPTDLASHIDSKGTGGQWKHMSSQRSHERFRKSLLPGVFGINELRGSGAVNVLSSGTVRSDTDAQLILHVPFSQTVKLTAVSIEAPVAEEAPTILKLCGLHFVPVVVGLP
jgi:hypothetical protein